MIIEDNYYIKSVSIKRDLAWKPFAYTISYYREWNDKFISSFSFTVEDFKKLYGDIDVNTLTGSRCKIKKELILK